MPRYKITIEYDGTGLAGWQRQEHAPSVQQLIEQSIKIFSREDVVVHGAGRTDAGVHALGQIAHFDLNKSYPIKEIIGAINYHLKPNKIIITDCLEVNTDFHSRFSAIKRYYRYDILNRESICIFDIGRAWHIRDKLNISRMQEAASILLGEHDFTSFRAARCQAKSAIKTMDEISISKQNDKIIFNLKATSFLHHMVRNLVGSLVLVGINKWEIENIKTVLESKDRKKAGPTAPACGLYFLKVDY